ncbi:FtsX-like permease family protein [Paenibacillus sp. MMS18-CY102]|nr:FtsX-like permease family protein [Paenibacillus sp. MMS18-CY102]
MNFPQFAFNNVRRNARAYSSFMLSSAFMVMIFFTYSVFMYHPGIDRTAMGQTTQMGMTVATCIVYVFAFFFVLYSISVFLKSRNREFGILMILGAQSRQINLLILLENMLIGLISIVCGIASGLLLSKLFLIASTRMMEMEELPFYWPMKAMAVTASAFILLFLVISVFTLFFIRGSQALELLTGGSRPKKAPRVNLFFALLGTALLATGYAALHLKFVGSLFIPIAAVTGIAGTYFFYSQLTVWIVRFVQKRRRFTWKGTNLLWISEMSYKLKDNARILFLVTVVTSIASMCVGFVLATQQTVRTTFENNPFAISYTPYEKSDDKAIQATFGKIDQELRAANLPYRKLTVETLSLAVPNGPLWGMRMMSEKQYNKFATDMQAEPAPSLKDKAALLVVGPDFARGSANWNTIDIYADRNKDAKLSFDYEIRTEPLAAVNGGNKLLIVNDSTYSQLQKSYASQKINVDHTVLYQLTNSVGLPDRYDPETVAGMKIIEWNDKLQKQGDSSGFIQARADLYFSQKQMFMLLDFIGLFLALIFSLSSASFLYFKLYSELAADGITYRALSKIGLSNREMNRSATLQIAIIFFIPIVVSTIQTFVVLKPVLSMVQIAHVTGPVLIASAAFLVMQIIYFIIARSRYIRSVNRMMV